jgi:hypothetical protein
MKQYTPEKGAEVIKILSFTSGFLHVLVIFILVLNLANNQAIQFCFLITS